MFCPPGLLLVLSCHIDATILTWEFGFEALLWKPPYGDATGQTGCLFACLYSLTWLCWEPKKHFETLNNKAATYLQHGSEPRVAVSWWIVKSLFAVLTTHKRCFLTILKFLLLLFTLEPFAFFFFLKLQWVLDLLQPSHRTLTLNSATDSLSEMSANVTRYFKVVFISF